MAYKICRNTGVSTGIVQMNVEGYSVAKFIPGSMGMFATYRSQQIPACRNNRKR